MALFLMEVLEVAKAKTSVAAVRKLIGSEEQALAKLQKRRKALMAAEEEEFANLKAKREAFAAAEEKAQAALVSRREALTAQLEEIAAQIAALGGEAAPEPKAEVEAEKPKKPTKVKRAKKKAARGPAKAKKEGRGITLREAIGKIISSAGKPMRASEIASKLGSTGFKTKSKSPANLVSATLAQSKDFQKVRKGLYRLARSARKAAG